MEDGEMGNGASGARERARDVDNFKISKNRMITLPIKRRFLSVLAYKVNIIFLKDRKNMISEKKAVFSWGIQEIDCECLHNE